VFVPSSSGSSSSEVRLYTNSQQRDMYDNLANLYAIIRTAEALEKAYARDAVAAADYKQEMFKLISHYKSAREATREYVTNISQFLLENQLGQGGAGFMRLEKGFPNIEKNHNPKTIAEAVQHFISLMDALRLNMVAVDQIQPLLSDLVEAVHKCALDGSFEPGKIELWLKKFNAMSANDELDADAVRQLLFDLDQSYSAFHKALK
jgi:ESCRT-I complex subunit VPS28